MKEEERIIAREGQSHGIDYTGVVLMGKTWVRNIKGWRRD